jgi:formyl-CoA transferase
MGTPLEGIRAIDWGAFANGPLIGVMLGDLGADVIKIEDPVSGDPSRGMQSMYGSSMNLPHGRNVLIEATNRNKRSITIDLKKEEGKKIVQRIIRNSDIFFTNYTMIIANRLRMDYKTLSQFNPRLIYCNASGFGTKGPDAGKRAFDSIALARMGLMMAAGEEGSPPAQITGAIADTMGASMATLGILAALACRERTDIGQEVETSLLHALIWLQYTSITTYLLRGNEMRRYSRPNAANPMANHYECKDHQWIMLAEPQSDRFWHEFCEVLNIPEMENDNKFKNAKARVMNKRELIEILDRVFATKERDAWIKEFEKAEVKFAYGPINTLAEAMEDPQVIANGYIVDYNHPVLGATKQVALPAKFSESEVSIRYPAPEIGQHTEEILLEIGYSWEDIANLRDQKVI